MTSTMINKVSEYHNRLVVAVAQSRGQELTQAQILDCYLEAYPNSDNDLQWIQASDHSKNHTNSAPCLCSGTVMSIFERISHGKYRVL
jgi:hypothetical protein